MKNGVTIVPGLAKPTARGGFIARRLAMLAIGIALGLGWDSFNAFGQPTDSDDAPEAEVLTRGPVHEAFAGVVSFNPEPGIVVSNGPPEPIEEIPPAERPEGDNVAWIPGYWAWDDERNEFLWISGTWRALPPGRQWIAGYWGEISDGYQWISGYWADNGAGETTYLPPPPTSVETGPNIAAPAVNTSGCPAVGFGITTTMRGNRVIGRRAAPIGIGYRHIISGRRVVTSSSPVIGIIRCCGAGFFLRPCTFIPPSMRGAAIITRLAL